MNKYTPLNVIARAPFQLYFEGQANSITAANKVGKFDILPGHADFFSLINPGQVIIGTDSEEINIPISNGIICVNGDEVMLFLNL